jgi:phage gp45-like
MAGYKVDPENGKSLLIYLGGTNSPGWVMCSFNLTQWRYREDRVGAGNILVLIPKDGTEVRMAKGAQIDILGDCAGWDEMVKLTKCDVPR